MVRFHGLDGTEIYNTTSGLPRNCRPYSGAFIDVLATKGVLLPCMAANDTHTYHGDETCSYLLVKAEELSREAILDAIRRGNFYATQGPMFTIEEVCLDGKNFLYVKSTPVRSIVFFTNLVWEGDRSVCGEEVHEALYQIKPDTRFVRVELTDADGKSAWSSFVDFRDRRF